MTRDEKIRKCYELFLKLTRASTDPEIIASRETARELIAEMGQEPPEQATVCQCDPRQIGYVYTPSGMRCTYCGLLR